MSLLSMIIRKKIIRVYRKMVEKNTFQPEFENIIICEDSDVKFMSDYSNVIIHVKKDDVEGYFHECRVHERFDDYIKKIIDDYFDYMYVGEHSDTLRKIIKKTLKNKMNMLKFENMGALHSKRSNVTYYIKRIKGASSLGFHGKYPAWFDEEFRKFIRYIWAPIEDYNNNCFLDKTNTKLQMFNAKKSKLMKIIAEELGVGYIVPSSEYVILKIKDDIKYGILIEPAKGIDPNNARLKAITPAFQKELVELRILDTICYQLDHRPGNYFVTINNNMADRISAFDNDCTTTFKARLSVEDNDYMGYEAIVKKQMITCPYLPVELVSRLMKISLEEEMLRQYLSRMQIYALKYRIKQLKKAIRFSLNHGWCQLLQSQEWSRETIKLEVNNTRNGYLRSFYKNYICTD